MIAKQRSEIMRAVKSRDTGPEMIVRRLLHRLGYRYRLHRKDLPCKPDLVFPSKRKIIFINGCFWHGHSCPRGARMPATNVEYWQKKISRNIGRDAECNLQLRDLGWKLMTIWECELKDMGVLTKKLAYFLG